MTFEVRGLSKRFGSYTAVADVSLRVPSGELVALLGPSGCGKTTLLRVLAGLEHPDEGTVSFGGVDVTNVAPADRDVGLVFQHYALFEHMTVFDNVAFPLRVRRAPADKVSRRAVDLLGRVGLRDLAGRLPSQLSGGQRQRVALARALASEPRILLLDEPFGALDARVRQDLRAWIRALHAESGVTTVLVTHDREDAFEVADRVAIMNRGRLEQVGSPSEVFRNPASAWVMRFLGDVNEVPIPRAAGTAGEAVGLVRPHEIELSRSAANADAFEAKVSRLQAAGAIVRVELQALGRGFVAELDEQRFDSLDLRCGDTVFMSARRVRVFEPSREADHAGARARA